MSLLMRWPSFTISSSEVPGTALFTWTTKLPSRKSGMNWPPRKGSHAKGSEERERQHRHHER